MYWSISRTLKESSLKACIDIECDKLVKPTKIWLVVLKDIDTGVVHVFREPTQADHRALLATWNQVDTFIGHNFLEYDYPVIVDILGTEFSVDKIAERTYDTLILSRLFDYSRGASAGMETGTTDPSTGSIVGKHLARHSIEAWGASFNYPKIKHSDFTKYSLEMEEYCVRDVEICYKIYNRYYNNISDPKWHASILLEHQFQMVVNDLHNNGFSFDVTAATSLLSSVSKDLETLDSQILTAFPPTEKLIREFTPKLTKFGSISRTSVPRSLWANIANYEAGQTYQHTRLVAFNPSSHKQIIEVLNMAKWKPVDKTQAHIDAERNKDKDKLIKFANSGWKINENNLQTLPSDAPAPARLLAKRILLESRRRSLTEWLSLLGDDGRIHGRFVGIGAWTGRMAHQKPNTANIPNDLDTQGKTKLLGKEMRSLWRAPQDRLLVGVDAEGIQLRIFAHYINDPEFTAALVKGRKDDKTDPHSLNQRILGSVCKSRAAAKRFIYALLLGAGVWKLSQILECSEAECQESLTRLLSRYTGWGHLKEKGIPSDAARGYFIGLDDRKVQIPGTTRSERRHLAMSGYLQSGESIVMKKATIKFVDFLKQEGSLLVNLVHDEWQTETPNNMEQALRVAEVQSRALREVGEELKLNCPLAGSYWNDDHKTYTIGTNWSVTH